MAVFQRFSRETFVHDEKLPGEIDGSSTYIVAHCAFCCVRICAAMGTPEADYLFKWCACSHCAHVRMHPHPEMLLAHHPKGFQAHFVFNCHKCKTPTGYKLQLGAVASGEKFLFFCDNCAADMVQMCSQPSSPNRAIAPATNTPRTPRAAVQGAY
jgi:hypothetical protein